MTTIAPTAAPANALTIWTNGKTLFVEIPSKEKGRAPYIISYNLAESGLSKALSLLRSHADTAGVPQVHRIEPPRKLVGTMGQHNLAQSILRRKGLLR